MTNQPLASPEVVIPALKSLITRSEAVIAKFKKNLDEDPTYAFSWGDSAVSAAATLQAASGALRALTEEGSKATVETLVEFYRKEVAYGARNPPSSSSQMSNLVRIYNTAAQAQVLDILTNFF